MLLGCLGDRSEDLVRAGEVWYVDIDYTTPPVLG